MTAAKAVAARRGDRIRVDRHHGGAPRAAQAQESARSAVQECRAVLGVEGSAREAKTSEKLAAAAPWKNAPPPPRLPAECASHFPMCLHSTG